AVPRAARPLFLLVLGLQAGGLENTFMSFDETKIVRRSSGNELAALSGGTVTLESGSLIDVQAGSVRKVNSTKVADIVTFAAAAGSANVCEVTITVKDGAGTAIDSPVNLDI